MLTEAQIDKIIGPLAGAVAGGSIAVLAGAFSNYLNFRLNRGGDRLKSLNLALYHLLRVHRYAECKLQGDPKLVFEKYIQALCEEQGVPPEDFQRIQEDNAHIMPLIGQRYEREVEDLNPKSLEEELLQAVHELSKVEPELAHRIALRSSWQNTLKHTGEYTQAVLSNMKIGELELSLVEHFSGVQSDELKEQILKDLRQDLLSVARAIGWRKYLKIRLHIKRVKRALSVDGQVKLISKETQPSIEGALEELQRIVEREDKKGDKEAAGKSESSVD